MDAFLPRAEQESTTKCELLLGLRVGQRRRIQPVENAAPLPIALRIDVVEPFEERSAFAEHRIDLGFGPDIELALFVLTVGVEAAGEPALLCQHFATDPFQG